MPKKSEFMKDLQSLQEMYAKASEREEQGAVEDGTYIAKLSEISLDRARSSQRLQVKWVWVLTEGPEEGTQVRDYDGIASEDNIFYFRNKLARLGCDLPSEFVEIEDLLRDLTDRKPLVRIRVRTKDNYTHVNIDRLLEESTPPEEEDEPKAKAGKKAAKPAPAEEEEEEEEEETPPKKKAAKPEKKSGKVSKVEPEVEEEPEVEAEPEVEEEDVELSVGMRVMFVKGGVPEEGEIVGLLEDEEKVRVKLDSDSKIYKVSLEKISLVDSSEAEEEEEEEAPKAKKGAKKEKLVKPDDDEDDD